MDINVQYKVRLSRSTRFGVCISTLFSARPTRPACPQTPNRCQTRGIHGLKLFVTLVPCLLQVEVPVTAFTSAIPPSPFEQRMSPPHTRRICQRRSPKCAAWALCRARRVAQRSAHDACPDLPYPCSSCPADPASPATVTRIGELRCITGPAN